MKKYYLVTFLFFLVQIVYTYYDKKIINFIKWIHPFIPNTCVFVCVCVRAHVRASALFSRYFVTRRFFNLRICCNTGELSAIALKKKSTDLCQFFENTLH